MELAEIVRIWTKSFSWGLFTALAVYMCIKNRDWDGLPATLSVAVLMIGLSAADIAWFGGVLLPGVILVFVLLSGPFSNDERKKD